MGYYNVIPPCVVGKLHYVNAPTQPIEVDDEVAAPLVEAGSLQACWTGSFSEQIKPGAFRAALDVVQLAPVEAAEPAEPTEPAPPRPRGRRKAAED